MIKSCHIKAAHYGDEAGTPGATSKSRGCAGLPNGCKPIEKNGKRLIVTLHRKLEIAL
jgi:hypothetical protein